MPEEFLSIWAAAYSVYAASLAYFIFTLLKVSKAKLNSLLFTRPPQYNLASFILLVPAGKERSAEDEFLVPVPMPVLPSISTYCILDPSLPKVPLPLARLSFILAVSAAPFVTMWVRVFPKIVVPPLMLSENTFV